MSVVVGVSVVEPLSGGVVPVVVVSVVVVSVVGNVGSVDETVLDDGLGGAAESAVDLGSPSAPTQPKTRTIQKYEELRTIVMRCLECGNRVQGMGGPLVTVCLPPVLYPLTSARHKQDAEAFHHSSDARPV